MSVEIVDAFDVQILAKASKQEDCDWCRSVLQEHGMALTGATPARFVVLNHDGSSGRYACIGHVGMLMVGWDSLGEEGQ